MTQSNELLIFMSMADIQTKSMILSAILLFIHYTFVSVVTELSRNSAWKFCTQIIYNV